MDLEEFPSSDSYSLLSQAYYQLEEYETSLKHIETAIELQESRDIPITRPILDEEGNETGETEETGETKKGIAKENHYLLKMALFSELKRELDVLPIYEILVQHYPKKRYWTQLSGLYGQENRTLDQMGALEAAYDDGLLDKQREFTALSQLLYMFDNPRKAASVLQNGFDRKIIKEEEKTLKAIAQYWHASKELTKAKPYYKKAAKVAKEGELYIYLGQVHFGLDEFSEAREAIKLGIKKGKLKDEVSAHMLLGQILFENQEWDNAIVSFRKCIDVAEKQFGVKKKTKKAKEKQKEKKKKAQDQARKWITYTEGEEERVEALKLKRKALGI
jgi:tetratricopeptide (TPR) repeat protein